MVLCRENLLLDIFIKIKDKIVLKNKLILLFTEIQTGRID